VDSRNKTQGTFYQLVRQREPDWALTLGGAEVESGVSRMIFRCSWESWPGSRCGLFYEVGLQDLESLAKSAESKV